MADKKILISQRIQGNTAIYDSLKEKYNIDIEFKPFFKIQALDSREFREKVGLNILDFTAIVFSSRHAIDAFFKVCEDLRIKIESTMKYFCTTEAVAVYLQKHIVFRKRKIFSGIGTPQSLLDIIKTKHSKEKFLIVTSDSSNSDKLYNLFKDNNIDCNTGVFFKTVAQDIEAMDLDSYSAIVLHNPNDVRSLFEKIPNFEQKEIKFITYGKAIQKAMTQAKLNTEIAAPTAEITSIAKAIETYLEKLK